MVEFLGNKEMLEFWFFEFETTVGCPKCGQPTKYGCSILEKEKRTALKNSSFSCPICFIKENKNKGRKSFNLCGG